MKLKSERVSKPLFIISEYYVMISKLKGRGCHSMTDIITMFISKVPRIVMYLIVNSKTTDIRNMLSIKITVTLASLSKYNIRPIKVIKNFWWNV